MTRVDALLERARNTFWILPAAGILAGILAGLLLPLLDDELALPEWLALDSGVDTTRSLLVAIATVAVSIAGISFSVIAVALVLLSQQLSPRVLRTFQRHPLNQVVLGTLLGTATLSLFVLAAIDEGGEGAVPELGVTVATAALTISLLLFVFFLHHLVRSLNASAVIRRIAADGHQATDNPTAEGVGCEPEDPERAAQVVAGIKQSAVAVEVEAARAGYVAALRAFDIYDAAVAGDAFIEQRAQIGDFVLEGGSLACVWSRREPDEILIARIRTGFMLSEQRETAGDVGFPVRQLTDIALKGLSPAINDPTTAENAMNSLADTLARVGRRGLPQLLRVDSEANPRLLMTDPGFDDLVRAGFEQVRHDAASRPPFALRLLELLAELRDAGGGPARESREIGRQARLLCEHACAVATLETDRREIADCHARLHGDPPAGR